MSTFSEGIYNEIINDNLWAPNYTVRDFIHNEDFKKTPKLRQNSEHKSNDVVDTPIVKNMKNGHDRNHNLRRNILMNNSRNRALQQNYNVTPSFNRNSSRNGQRMYQQNMNVKWKDIEQTQTPNSRRTTDIRKSKSIHS